MQCPQFNILHAYHDGELSAERRRTFDDHLATCLACQEELASLRTLSRAFNSLKSETLDANALAATHRLVDEQAVPALSDYDVPIYRFGLALTALAASIVVLVSVWSTPATPNASPVAVAVAPAAEWERLALTLRVDRVTFDSLGQDSTIMLADASRNDARVADWMLKGLTNSTE